MAAVPELQEKNVKYVFSSAERLLSSAKNIKAGSSGEKYAADFYLNELKAYCDEASSASFSLRPGAQSIILKVLCAVLSAAAIVFIFAESVGSIAAAAVCIALSLACFCIFVYKYVFDGTRLDFVSKKSVSQNVFSKRYSSSAATKRIVISAHTDAPLKLRSLFFGNKAPLIFSVCSIIGNTLLFCSCLLFLFSGAPKNTMLFQIMSTFSAVFIVFYFFSFFLVNPQKASPGITSSVVPALVATSIFKQMSETGFRFYDVEVCCLITGGEYAGRAGAYAFAEKHKRLFRDIPTVFVTLDEITSSGKMCVVFSDGSGVSGSAETASYIASAAENLGIEMHKESQLLGTASFTPFAKSGFSAAAVGTSKKLTAKSFTGSGDRLSAVTEKTVSDVGALILETLNYLSKGDI